MGMRNRTTRITETWSFYHHDNAHLPTMPAFSHHPLSHANLVVSWWVYLFAWAQWQRLKATSRDEKLVFIDTFLHTVFNTNKYCL